MLEKVSLFTTKRDFLLFLLFSLFILTYTLLMEYQNYKNLTRYNSTTISATVINQYTKIKDTKTYQLLKLRTDNGAVIYTSAKNTIGNLKNKKFMFEVWAGKKSFYEYITSFYAFTKILYAKSNDSLKHKINQLISSQHKDDKLTTLYKALYTATPLSKELYAKFSTLGVSHLLAISGFHLGVLSGVLFFLIKYPYKFLQSRYFPYRSFKLDTFIIITVLLFCYLLFLDAPPSLVRAFGMLVIGFLLYNSGIKIISMQTLLLSVILLIALFPRLCFSLGFWLSVSGVFYIFLFLLHFKDLGKIWQFLLVPVWVYLLMLPYSLSIFGSFSLYHPLSIIWTSLFSIFYPLSILLHLSGFGAFFDTLLLSLINLGEKNINVELPLIYLAIQIFLSLVSIYEKKFVWILILFSVGIFVYALSNLVR